MAPDPRRARSTPALAAGAGRAAAAALVLALSLALPGCKGTLYDAAGVPALEGSIPCEAPSRVCGGACVSQSAAACGDGCEVCPGATGAADITCELAAGGKYACGYTCPAGQLACPSGCCQATAVAAGEAHACAVTDDAALLCWGLNDRGQVGPAAAGATVARPVQVFADGVTAVAAGAHHTCAVRAGAVTCWGANDGGQLGTGTAGTGGPTPVTAGLTGASTLALGTAHSCALVGSAVTCWGANAQGQLGAGDTAVRTAQKTTPVNTGVTMLTAAGDSTCAATASGVTCWGADARGQAGAGGTARAPRSTPGPVAGLPAGTPLSLSVGGLHACAAYGAGAGLGLWCWGANDQGQLGTGATGGDEPSAVAAGKIDNGTRSVLSLTGGGHTCTAKRELPTSATLKCAGRNDQQQVGIPLPSSYPDGNDVSLAASLLAVDGTPPPGTAAAAGGDFTCVLVGPAGATGVKCWGGNASGQLGRGAAGASQGAADFVSGKL